MVMMTSSSRGRSSCLIARPSMTSENPFEYTWSTTRSQNEYQQRCSQIIMGDPRLQCRTSLSRARIWEKTDHERLPVNLHEETHANLMCSTPASSPSTQLCQPGSPYDMQPKMSLDTFRPELPRRTAEAIRVRTALQATTLCASCLRCSPYSIFGAIALIGLGLGEEGKRCLAREVRRPQAFKSRGYRSA